MRKKWIRAAAAVMFAAGIAACSGGKSADELLMSGMQKAAQSDYDGAIADYSAAIEQDPGNAALYVTRAGAYDLSGDSAAALEDYKKAVELDPSLEPALKEQMAHLGGR